MRSVRLAAAVALLLVVPLGSSEATIDASRDGPSIQVPLDGNVTLTASVSGAGDVEVATVAADGTPHMSVRPAAVFEFQDLDADGHFDLGDPVVQRIPFSDLPLRRVQEVDGGLWLRFDLPEGSGRHIHLDLRPVGDANGTDVLAMDWRIERFPFATDNRTQLALETRVQGGSLASSTGMEAGNGTWRLGWSWASAQANTTLVPYASAAGDETMVAFSLARGDALAIETTWSLRPVVEATTEGLRLPDLRVGDVRIFVIATLAAVVAVGGSAYRVMKRER